MKTTRTAVSAVAALALAGSLAACGDAVNDAANKAKAKASEAAASAAAKGADAAKSAASDAAEKAKAKAGDKAGDMAGSMFEDIKAKLSPEQQKKLESLDTVGLGKEGELAQDADSLTVADYFAARQAAVPSGDLSALREVAAARGLRNAKRYIRRGHAPKTFSVDVVSSESGTVDVCVGPQGQNARTLTVKDGKVVLNAPGTHTC
jgi:hypothetical protein